MRERLSSCTAGNITGVVVEESYVRNLIRTEKVNLQAEIHRWTKPRLRDGLGGSICSKATDEFITLEISHLILRHSI